MVFPQTVLGATVELNLGSWTDITNYVFQRTPIVSTHGKENQASQINPAQCAMTLNNRDYRFSINNPSAAYYGTLVRNTPIRTSVPNSLLPSPLNTTYLRMEDDAVSYASCPAASRIELAGSLDVRVDVELSTYGFMPLAAVWNASASVNQRCWYFGLNANGSLSFSYTTDGTVGTWDLNTLLAAPNSRVPIPMGRLCARAVLNASAGTVTFYTAPAGSATSATGWTQLGATVTGLGTVTLFTSASAPLTVGYSAGLSYDWVNSEINSGSGNAAGALLGVEGALIAPQGDVYDMALYNAAATLVAHPSFNTQTAGATSWTDSPGNTWSLSGTASLNNRSYRFHGELADLAKSADSSGGDVYARATGAGLMRRIQQGQSPLSSPMYRSYVRLTGVSVPNAYWPCEDGTNATQLASGLGSGRPMSISGKPQLSANTDFVCSAPLPVLSGSTWSGNVSPSATAWTANYIRFLMQVPTSGDTNSATVMSVYTTGSVNRMDLVYTTAGSGGITFNCYNAAGANIAAVGPVSFLISYDDVTEQAVPVDGALAEVTLQLTISGSTVTAALVSLVVGSAAYGVNTAAISSSSIGAVTRVVVNPQGALSGTVIGHIGVQQNTTLVASNSLIPAFNAWFGETAGDRVRRLSSEQGMQSRIYGHSDLSAQMGYQQIETFQQLLQECEDTDNGMLTEPPGSLAVGYRTLNSMYSQSAKATADFPSAALNAGLEADTDDLLTVNDVTAANADGSSARQALTVGPMSVNAPPAGIGLVDTRIQANAADDSQLPAIAQWVLHASTDSHDRVPVLPFNMARPQTPASIATLRAGDVLAVTNPPPWMQPDEVDQVCLGFTETYGPFGVWEIDVNGIPAYPYAVMSVAPAVSGASSFAGAGPFATHVDTDGTTLTSNVASAATGVSFTTTATGTPVWTTNPADFPFDVQCAGERLTVVGPGTCLGTDPFLVNGVADYSGQQATISFSAAHGAPYAANGYATSAVLAAPVGSPDTYADVVGTASAAGTVATSTGYKLWAWVFNTTGRTYTLFANWLLGAGYVSSTLATGVAIPGGVWTLITGTVTSPSSGVNAMQLGVGDQSSPGTGNTFYVWGLNGCASSGISAASPQGFTAVRSVNGVVKAQTAGTALSLWYAPTIGM